MQSPTFRIPAVPTTLSTAIALALAFAPAIVLAQDTPDEPQATTLDRIEVTGTRIRQVDIETEQPVLIISRAQIERQGFQSVADILQNITAAGTPAISRAQPLLTGENVGGQFISMRNLNPNRTLILVNGRRLGQSTTGLQDVSLIPASAVERMEVLKDGASSLYGSDAIGGVINIITRRGRGEPRASIAAEGGSYGSKGLQAAVSGGDSRFNYAVSLNTYDTAGFSRWGYRIGRLQAQHPWPLENDGARRFGLSTRFGFSPSEDVTFDVGGSAYFNYAQTDAAFGAFPDTPSSGIQRFGQVHAKATVYTFDRRLKNTFLVYANRTARDYRSISYYGAAAAPVTDWSKDGFTGGRIGASYQGDLSLDDFGLFTFGGQVERETMKTTSQPVLPVPGARTTLADAAQTTRSLFALHQITIADRLNLSLGGRIDDIEGADRFATWRATLAYDITESDTVLRASAGTGAKAPTLYQRLDPVYGNAALGSERSFGVDAGIDQKLFDGRLTLSGTVFLNRYRDLINFQSDPSCRPDQTFGCFVNVARAETSGFELSAKADIIPGMLGLDVAYTNLIALDLGTGLRLARRPENSARIGLTLTPTPGLVIAPSLVLVDTRYSSAHEQDRLPPYARLDLFASYDVSERVSIFLRGENLTNARYEEVKNFGTAGRSVYAGLRATW